MRRIRACSSNFSIRVVDTCRMDYLRHFIGQVLAAISTFHMGSAQQEFLASQFTTDFERNYFAAGHLDTYHKDCFPAVQ